MAYEIVDARRTRRLQALRRRFNQNKNVARTASRLNRPMRIRAADQVGVGQPHKRKCLLWGRESAPADFHAHVIESARFLHRLIAADNFEIHWWHLPMHARTKSIQAKAQGDESAHILFAERWSFPGMLDCPHSGWRHRLRPRPDSNSTDEWAYLWNWGRTRKEEVWTLQDNLVVV